MNFYPKLKLLLFLLLFCGKAIGQKEANNWYFGVNAGLDFNSGAPVALTNGNLDMTIEGCAAISDADGNLLFYTNGVSVWDRNHQKMPNGEFLNGNTSASQGAIIVPDPSSTSHYYIFTVDALENSLAHGVLYHSVNMALNGGMGDVEGKNIPLMLTTTVTEKMTAVRHRNGADYWVVVHGWNSDAFLAFRVTEFGVNPFPVTSNVGMALNSTSGDGNAAGCMKISPSGSRIAMTIKQEHKVQVFDFNDETGVVSNPVTFDGTWTFPYGIEFSPDNSKLYVSQHVLNPAVVQFNLSAGSDAAVAASGTIVGTTADQGIGTLQLGPDGKIYVAKHAGILTGQGRLGVIQNPNQAGAACGYSDNGPFLNGRDCLSGLPNFVASFFAEPQIGVDYFCQNKATHFTLGNAGTITSVVWDFGDPASGAANQSTLLHPKHTFSTDGSFLVSATYTTISGSVTITKTIQINPGPVVTISPSGTLPVCRNASAILQVSGQPGYTYHWMFNDLHTGVTSQTFAATQPGTYQIDVRTAAGCTDTFQVAEIAVLPAPNVQVTSGTAPVCEGAPVTLTASGAGAYSWSNGSNGQTITVTASGQVSFSVTGTDMNGCTATAPAVIPLAAPPAISVSSEGQISGCEGQKVPLSVSGLAGYVYQWYHNQQPLAGATATEFEATEAGTYQILVTSHEGCSKSFGVAEVSLRTLPVITVAVPIDTLCSGDEVILSASGAATYSWNTGVQRREVTVSPKSTETFTVNGTDNNGCSNSAPVTMPVKDCPLLVPNIITPNNDGINDFLVIKTQSTAPLELRIFNRYGSQIYHSGNYQNNWPGDDIATGVYYYSVHNPRTGKMYKSWLEILK